MLRKRSIALFFTVLVTGLLAGNMVGYVLCRFATAEETIFRDCGCDVWLNGTQASAEADGTIQRGPVKTVSPDSMPPQHCTLAAAFVPAAAAQVATGDARLPDRPGDAVFHPPASC